MDAYVPLSNTHTHLAHGSLRLNSEEAADRWLRSVQPLQAPLHQLRRGGAPALQLRLVLLYAAGARVVLSMAALPPLQGALAGSQPEQQLQRWVGAPRAPHGCPPTTLRLLHRAGLRGWEAWTRV